MGDSTQSAVASAEIGKRAVENNSLMGDEFRAGLNADKEEYKRKVREQFGENAVSQVLNGVINVVADTGDLTVLAADSAFDLAAAVVTCSIGEGYCNQAQKDLASKSQGAADILTSLINGETWSAIKTTANAAYNGDQVALENLSGVLIGITLPNKAIKGISANEKLPATGQSEGYVTKSVNITYNNAPMGSRFNQMNQPVNPSYQSVRNEITNINGRQYSGHALDRMQDRGITPSVVENAIKHGIVSDSRGDAKVYTDQINRVKVVLNNNGDVITVTYGK